MMTGMELRAIYRLLLLTDAADTRHRVIITLWLVRRTKQTGPSSKISFRHMSHASLTSTDVVTAAFKTRTIQKELGYKNADKASKLAPLQRENFPTHELHEYRVSEDTKPRTQYYAA